MIENAFDEAIAAAQARCAELRRAALALLYVRAQQRAALEQAQRDLAAERRATTAARARSPELGRIAASRSRRAQRRVDGIRDALAELGEQIEEVAGALHAARQTLCDLRTERLQAVAVRTQAHAMRARPELDESPGGALDEARDALFRLRALTSLEST